MNTWSLDELLEERGDINVQISSLTTVENFISVPHAATAQII
jgi:hypothetical protein